LAECKEGCGRIARSRGMCSSHYRRWRTGKLDAPVRGYQRYEEGPNGVVIPVQASPPLPRERKRKRKSPWVKEMELLRSLGLR
jgi:hypothetical protein